MGMKTALNVRMTPSETWSPNLRKTVTTSPNGLQSHNQQSHCVVTRVLVVTRRAIGTHRVHRHVIVLDKAFRTIHSRAAAGSPGRRLHVNCRISTMRGGSQRLRLSVGRCQALPRALLMAGRSLWGVLGRIGRQEKGRRQEAMPPMGQY